MTCSVPDGKFPKFHFINWFHRIFFFIFWVTTLNEFHRIIQLNPKWRNILLFGSVRHPAASSDECGWLGPVNEPVALKNNPLRLCGMEGKRPPSGGSNEPDNSGHRGSWLTSKNVSGSFRVVNFRPKTSQSTSFTKFQSLKQQINQRKKFQFCRRVKRVDFRRPVD